MNLYRNDKLRAAFDLYVRRQDALLPTEEELSSVTLSPEFHARMAKLLTRRKRGYYRMFGTWGRRVASILIALLIATTTVTFSVKALRESVFHFFTEVYEKFTQVLFVDDEQSVPKASIDKREPMYIPDGYVMESEEYHTLMYTIVYTNDNGGCIVYEQVWKNNALTTVDTEDIRFSHISVGSYHGIVYTNKGNTTLVITDEKYAYILSATLKESELIKIVETVLKK